MKRFGYTVTPVRNAEIEHWRGLLRGYVVTQGCGCGCAWVQGRACGCVQVRVMHVCVTA